MGHAGNVGNIIDSPPALVAAHQPGQRIEIANHGPVTVWLSGDQSVAPGSGWKLPPGETIVWTDSGPVYAVTYMQTLRADNTRGARGYIDVLVGPP